MSDLSDGKQLLNASLSTLSMVFFAFPGGAPVGIAVMVLQGVFDAILGEPPPPPSPYMSRAELKDAVDAVTAKILDAIWKGQEDDITDEILALQQGFLEVYASMSRLKMDGERYVLSVTNETVSNFITNTDAYFDMTEAVKPTGILSTLRGFRNFLELGTIGPGVLSDVQITQHKTMTIGLYGLIGSLTCSYLKSAVLWHWGRELLIVWQYQQYKTELASWDNDPGTDPAKKYPGVNTDPSYQAPTWDEWKKPKTNPASLLIEEVQDLLNYCILVPAQNGKPAHPGLYPTILGSLTDLDTKLSAGEAGLTFGAAVTKAQMINAAETGAKGAGWLEVLIPQNGFDQVSEDEFLTFGKTIDGWRGAMASVSFSTHPVVAASETLTSIATTEKEYQGEAPAVFAQKLYLANPGVKFLGQPPPNGDCTGLGITVGTVIKIFEKDAFTYLPIAQGGTQ